MGIINDKFMFTNKTGKKLFFDYAKDLPIIDYHCHLMPEMIANDYKFKDTYDLFLGGDHYKWRQLRSFGIDEEMITGDGDRYEKWLGFARVMPYLIGNPLYHWTAMEFKRYFNIDEPLTEKSAKRIWDICNEKLKGDDFSAKSLIQKSNVEVICTTDDPQDDLRYHKQLKADGFGTKVLPTFRPDKLVNIDKQWFDGYIKDNGIETYDDLIAWLKDRIAYFHENGCRLSDHALDYVPFAVGDAKAVFEKKIKGENITENEADVFKTEVIAQCAKEYARLGWTMQLHIGALRNNNTKMFNLLGPDTGFDSINDLCIAEKLSAMMNSLAFEDKLTGVRNNTAYLQELTRLKVEMQDEGTVFAVFVIDVNGLKQVNDTLGHAAGNELIIRTAESAVAVFGKERVYRIGGDEFAVIYPGADAAACDELKRAFEETVERKGKDIKLSVAIGSAIRNPKKDSNYEAVFERADNDMYRRKQEIKGRTSCR